MAVVLGKRRNAAEDVQIFHKTAERTLTHSKVSNKFVAKALPPRVEGKLKRPTAESRIMEGEVISIVVRMYGGIKGLSDVWLRNGLHLSPAENRAIEKP